MTHRRMTKKAARRDTIVWAVETIIELAICAGVMFGVIWLASAVMRVLGI